MVYHLLQVSQQGWPISQQGELIETDRLLDLIDHFAQELPGGKDPRTTVEKNGLTVIRGGAWCSRPLYCESSFRNSAPARQKLNFIGFRIALMRSN